MTFLDGADNEIWTAGAGYQAGKLGLNAMYLRGSNDYEKDRSWDKDGWVAGLTYGGAESDKPGSWGLLATYYDQSASTVIAHTMDGNWDTFVPGESGVTNGFKGWKVGGNLTLAKKHGGRSGLLRPERQGRGPERQTRPDPVEPVCSNILISSIKRPSHH